MKSLIPSLLVSLGIASLAGAAQPNILLIMADDVGSDAVGSYGGQSHPTPHIDALTGGGMKFTYAFSMPVCHPTRMCLMTGRYPFRFGKEGSKWGDFPKAAEGITIAHRMKKGGYATAVAGKWQLCTMKKDLDHPARLGFDQWLLFGWHEGGRYHDPMLYQNGKLREDTAGRYGPDLYVEFLIDFMRRSHEAGKPFFAYYPMALCHDVTDDLKGTHVAFYKDGRWMTYAEMISSMDDMVGRLVRSLDEMGLREDTLVIFTTDNGTPSASYLTVDENGKMIRPRTYSIRDGEVVPGGKGKTGDTGTRVPLVANWPGKIGAGTEADNLVDLTDLLPTLAEVAGLPDDGVSRDGVSFAPVLFGKREKFQGRPWIFIEHRDNRCVRSRWWKLYGNGRFYDLKSDPGENAPIKEADLTEAAKVNHAELRKVLESLTGP